MYDGILRISLSKNISDLKNEIESFIEKLNVKVLKTETNGGFGALIKSISVNDEGFQLHLISDKTKRGHSLCLMIKNKLKAFLGQNFHIGVRKVVLTNYSIVFDIDYTKIEIIKKKISGLNEIQKTSQIDKKILVEFNEIDESQLKSNIIDRIINLIYEEVGEEELVFRISKVKPGTILSKGNPKELKIKDDLTTLLEEMGWIKRFIGRGQWIYLPPYTTIFRVIWELCREIAIKLGYKEALFPKLIHTDVMMRMKYFEGLPEGMYYACHAERNPVLFEEFKKELRIYNKLPIDILKKGLNDPEYVLAPAQCEPFYQLFYKEILDKSNLPIKLFDASGFTYRYEGGGVTGLTRVNEFQRVELVEIGTPDQVKEIAEETTAAYEKLCDLLNFEWYIEAGDDPFYLAGRRYEDRAIEFPDIPKKEVRIKLPKNESMSTGSINLHGTHFVEGFKIKTNFGQKLWTGCTGFGVSRIVYGFLIYNGLNLDDWPEPIKKRIGCLPDTPKTLTWPRNNKEGNHEGIL